MTWQVHAEPKCAAPPAGPGPADAAEVAQTEPPAEAEEGTGEAEEQTEEQTEEAGEGEPEEEQQQEEGKEDPRVVAVKAALAKQLKSAQATQLDLLRIEAQLKENPKPIYASALTEIQKYSPLVIGPPGAQQILDTATSCPPFRHFACASQAQ